MGFGFVYVGNFKAVGFKFSRWQDVAFYQLFLPSKTISGKPDGLTGAGKSLFPADS